MKAAPVPEQPSGRHTSPESRSCRYLRKRAFATSFAVFDRRVVTPAFHCAPQGSILELATSRGRITTQLSRDRRRIPTDPPGDLLVQSYARSFGLNASITRGSNTYGPYQFPEKLIPLFTTNAFDGKDLPLYGDGMQVREMLFVEDHCSAIDLVFHTGTAGETYNVGAEHEVPNIETAHKIIELTGADPNSLKRVADRPGHDRRYALDCSKLRGIGWERKTDFDTGLGLTIEWFRENRAWWEAIKSGEAFADYAAKNYGTR